MIKSKKDWLFYISIWLGVAIVITIYVFIYFATINKDYLYFERRNITVNLGDSYTIEELGLETNIDQSKLTIYCGERELLEDTITFDKAGNTKVVAKANNLKATLYVDVVFRDIDEYFDIYANVGVDKVYLTGDSVIELYLPSENREFAASEGYINSFSLGVDCLQSKDDFSIICGSNLVLSGNTIYANKIGTSKVYLDFESFGKSFEISVVIKEIPITNITSNHMFDTLYVKAGDRFDLDINVDPVYATDKSLEYSINGESIVFDGEEFIANDLGESFVTITGGIGRLIIKVVVCNIPDEMVVFIASPFVNGETGRAVVNFYNSGNLIDSDYYLECYIAGNKVRNDFCFENFEIKHNTFSLDVICEDVFVIKVISCKNSLLTFDIYVNN